MAGKFKLFHQRNEMNEEILNKVQSKNNNFEIDKHFN